VAFSSSLTDKFNSTYFKNQFDLFKSSKIEKSERNPIAFEKFPTDQTPVQAF
jgi:hypothetical protein